MDKVLLIIYFSFFIYLIFRWNFFIKSGLSPWFLSAAFVLKCIFSFLFFLVYTRYYTDRTTADVFKYFDDGKFMYSAIKTSPMDYLKMLLGLDFDTRYFHEQYYIKMNHWYKLWELTAYNDNRTMIRINALFFLFSNGNFHIHQVFSSFLSLIGLVSIFNVFKKDVFHTKVFAILLFFLPSVLFWTSPMIKESILIFGLGLFLRAFQQVFVYKMRSYYIFMLLSLCLLLILKTYMIFLCAPLLLSFLIVNKTASKPYIVYGSIIILLFLTSLSIRNPDYSIYYNMFQKQGDFINLAQQEKSGSLLTIDALTDYSFLSFIKTSPQALKISFILKWPWESNSMLEQLHVAENTLLWILTGFSFYYFLKNPTFSKNWAWFNFLFILGIFLLIGFTSPVLGAIVRYRAPLLPFWISLFCMVNVPIFYTFEKLKLIAWIEIKQPL